MRDLPGRLAGPGELEKLIAAGRGEAPAQEATAPRMWRAPERLRHDYEDDDRHPAYRRKKKFDLFDIFD